MRLIPLVAAAAAALTGCAGADGCPERFDSQAWKKAGPGDRRVELAGELERCNSLDGATKDEVREALGRPDTEHRYSWEYFTGEVNDVMGPGDAQTLYVDFTGLGRVKMLDAEPPGP